MSHAIAASQVSEFVESIFGEDLHAKRLESLANATTGVVRAGALGIHAIGRALAMARGPRFSAKHSVKQVDRLIGNTSLNVWTLFESWVPFVVAERSEIQVALDWTDFEADGQATLVASLITSHGRTTPLVWLSVKREDSGGQTARIEATLLQRLRETLPSTVGKVVIVADRGFGDPARWDDIRELGFDFLVRIRGSLRVANMKGSEKAAKEWLTPSGSVRTLPNARVTSGRAPVGAFVVVRKPAMKDPWCLVTSLVGESGTTLVAMYGRRFTIEESFRDIKDLRFGMGLSSLRVSTTERRDRLLLLSALAIALLTLLGAAGEAAGIDRHFKTNTSKKRQQSLFRQGCEYYQFLPVMRDEWAQPLIEKFGELLASHRVLEQALGFI